MKYFCFKEHRIFDYKSDTLYLPSHLQITGIKFLASQFNDYYFKGIDKYLEKELLMLCMLKKIRGKDENQHETLKMEVYIDKF